jgi:hypothetical protein
MNQEIKNQILRSFGSPLLGYWLEDWVSIPGRNKRFFSSPQNPHRLWEVHPGSYAVG